MYEGVSFKRTNTLRVADMNPSFLNCPSLPLHFVVTVTVNQTYSDPIGCNRNVARASQQAKAEGIDRRSNAVLSECYLRI